MKKIFTKKPTDDTKDREKSSTTVRDATLPTYFRSSCLLTEASCPAFGDECLRLVNIAFQTSQIFPLIMSKSGEIIQYLRTELFKRYPNEYFHILIGRNYQFGFAIEDEKYFVEIEHELYRVVIFTAKFNRQNRLPKHFTNSEMPIEWKIDKQSKN